MYKLGKQVSAWSLIYSSCSWQVFMLEGTGIPMWGNMKGFGTAALLSYLTHCFRVILVSMVSS